MNTSQWDKRSWLLALGGGNLCGLLFCGGYFADRYPYLHGEPTVLALCAIAVFGAVAALPVWLAATAHRNMGLWALVPPIILLLWVVQLAVSHDQFLELAQNSVPMLLCFVVTLLLTVPISLYRFVQRQNTERADLLQQAMQDAADAPQEGVWPPPPRRPTP